jgi:hypothetical protein
MSVGLTAEHAESAAHLRISAISALSAVRNKADLPTNTVEGDHLNLECANYTRIRIALHLTLRRPSSRARFHTRHKRRLSKAALRFPPKSEEPKKDFAIRPAAGSRDIRYPLAAIWTPSNHLLTTTTTALFHSFTLSLFHSFTLSLSHYPTPSLTTLPSPSFNPAVAWQQSTTSGTRSITAW